MDGAAAEAGGWGCGVNLSVLHSGPSVIGVVRRPFPHDDPAWETAIELYGSLQRCLLELSATRAAVTTQSEFGQ